MADLIPITYPWDVIKVLKGEFKEPTSSSEAWRPFIVTKTGNDLVNAVTGAKFPSRPIQNGYHIHEIHGPALRGELAHAVTASDGNNHQLKLTFQQDGNPESTNRNIRQFEPFFDQIMDTMLFIVREGLKNDQFKLTTHYWPELISLLTGNNQDDPAKYALVVDLARPKTLIDPLLRISDRPKRILRRIHDQERVQKVREIDTKCLTDLAKRPGAVIAEKAGPKQRILAIRRTESIDTLENRVTRHCCELVDRATKRYLNEHKEISPDKSNRVTSVQKLQRHSLRIPEKDSFRNVSRLLEPCRQPNYTLLQNADYFRVWSAYVKLVRNEDLRNDLWKWNRRLWVDFVKLYLGTIMNTFMESLGEDAISLIGNKTVLSERRHACGNWLFEDSLPGPFIVNPDSDQPLSLYLVEGNSHTLRSLSTDIEDLAILNADFMILTSRVGKLKALPVYALLPSYHLSDISYVNYIEGVVPGLTSAITKYHSFDSGVECVGGWVLLGNWRFSEYSPKSHNQQGIRYWITPVSADAREFTSMSTNWDEPLLTLCGA